MGLLGDVVSSTCKSKSLIILVLVVLVILYVLSIYLTMFEKEITIGQKNVRRAGRYSHYQIVDTDTDLKYTSKPKMGAVLLKDSNNNSIAALHFLLLGVYISILYLKYLVGFMRWISAVRLVCTYIISTPSSYHLYSGTALLPWS